MTLKGDLVGLGFLQEAIWESSVLSWMVYFMENPISNG
jgi:hypothetical protein